MGRPHSPAHSTTTPMLIHIQTHVSTFFAVSTVRGLRASSENQAPRRDTQWHAHQPH